ncbi:hypothetical protein Salat_2119100 [Sesamum alatum]|uniref:Uncharacterized protein n=1 Tax=Sesamum alatum TaxID=300844 RepID=A0AAE2CGY6_9LAMI|nr:hypothetical protein Salat_2119100 [Sesamum alatum]
MPVAQPVALITQAPQRRQTQKASIGNPSTKVCTKLSQRRAVRTYREKDLRRENGWSVQVISERREDDFIVRERRSVDSPAEANHDGSGENQKRHSFEGLGVSQREREVEKKRSHLGLE